MGKDKLLLKLGKVIRDKRIELGFSQEAFADVVDLHRTYIGSIERGEKNVAFLNLCKIAKGLKIGLKDLLISF